MGFDLATAAVVIGALGVGVSAVGQVQQSNAAGRMAAYQEAANRNNEIMAQQAAEDARQRGQIAEAQKRTETDILKGRQRAVLAANGVLVDTGTALDITSDTAAFGELDALTTRSNAEREALGYLKQGQNFSQEAQLAQLRGQSVSAALPYQLGGTVLSGATSVARDWYYFNRPTGSRG